MRNFNRKLGLLVADGTGQALDLSSFRVVFSVEKSAAEQPNKCRIEITNLSETTASQLLNGELKRVVLQAGYEENYGVIFDGNIISATRTVSGTESTTTIEAGDGDNAYSYAVVNQTIASGYSNKDVANAVAGTMTERGTRGVDAQGVDETIKYPRGRTMFGASRDYARVVAKSTECQWSIQDGLVVFCKQKSAREGGLAFLLSPQSGLIGSPVSDKDGVTAVACLNPQLKIYDPIQIESHFVNGTFKILSVKHTGDTHASNWQTEVKATAIDQSTKQTTQA